MKKSFVSTLTAGVIVMTGILSGCNMQPTGNAAPKPTAPSGITLLNGNSLTTLKPGVYDTGKSIIQVGEGGVVRTLSETTLVTGASASPSASNSPSASSSPSSSASPSANATATPTPSPTATATATATPTPTPTPTSTATPTPTPTPTATATATATPTPTPTPSASGTTLNPSASPSASATTSPSATPLPVPAAQKPVASANGYFMFRQRNNLAIGDGLKAFGSGITVSTTVSATPVVYTYRLIITLRNNAGEKAIVAKHDTLGTGETVNIPLEFIQQEVGSNTFQQLDVDVTAPGGKNYHAVIYDHE